MKDPFLNPNVLVQDWLDKHLEILDQKVRDDVARHLMAALEYKVQSMPAPPTKPKEPELPEEWGTWA